MALDLPDGTSCFIDSNILYYALVPTLGVSEHCIKLVERIIAGNISASVSIPVLSDVLHKVMVSEAAQLSGRDRAGMIGFLGKHPEMIGQLVQYPQAMERLSAIPLSVLPLDQQLLQQATVIAVQHRLLTNDALILALMRRHSLEHLVTNDDDFDGVAGINIWKPK